MRNTVRCILLSLMLLAGTAGAAEKPAHNESTRAPWDLKRIVGIVPRAGGFDVYWDRVNEFIQPVRTRFLRTRFARDGKREGEATLLYESQFVYGWTVADRAGTPIAIWQASGVVSSPISDGGLRYPGGTFIAAYAERARIRCGPRCVALWRSFDDDFAVELDSDGKPLGAPIALPRSWFLIDVLVVDDGLFVVRSIEGVLRVAFVDWNGRIRWDTLLLQGEPLSAFQPPLAVDYDGSNYVLAWVDRRWAASELRAFVIAPDGTPRRVETLLRISASESFGQPALAWNGVTHLLLISYGRALPGARLVALRFDRALTPVGTPMTIATPLGTGASGEVRALDESFIVTWNVGFSPMVTVVSPSGMSTPVEIDELWPRRRRVTR